MKLYCLIILFFAFRICNAQNLVTNPSFEDTIPSSVNPNCGGPEGAFPWFTPSTGTSDYFSMTYVCSGFWGGGGYQVPATGIAYCGFSLYDNYGLGNYREYIEGVLSDTMIANHTYCISFYTSLANTSQLAVDRIGAYISVDSVYDHSTNQCLTTFTPQIFNPIGNVLSDTLNWILISGNYTAQGGEKYITIGNFYNNAATTVDSVQGGIYKMAYYYVDDISVTDCTTGISEVNLNKIKNIFPNPFNDKLTIINDVNVLSEIILCDISSRKIIQKKFANTVVLNTEHLEKGIYLYEVRNENGLCKKGKVVKD